MNRRCAVVFWLLSVASSTCRAPHGPGVPRPPEDNDKASVVSPDDFGGDLQVHPSPGRALSPAEVDGVLRRLPSLKKEPGDENDFALRATSLPPPQPGQVVNATFPPPPRAAAPPAAVAGGPLAVVRLAPEGPVAIAPRLSVTFSQPMVEITSHAELAARDVPVKVKPSPAGQWRWAGTKTLVFEPTSAQGGALGATTVPQPTRFPASTVYQVTIPAGTKSAVGGTLARAKAWTFSTPTVKVVEAGPTGGPHRRDALMFVWFDQRIDPRAVLATISVAGRKGAALRMATNEEIAADDKVSSWVRAAEGQTPAWGSSKSHERRWLAFRTTEPLPAAEAIVVRVGPGTPSAEGPRRSEARHEFSFRTFGPMRPVFSGCGGGWPLGDARRCRPLQSFEVQFSNDIEAARFDPAMVKVSPEIPNLKVEAMGTSLRLSGRVRGRLTYNITVASGLTDVFGQSLGKAHKFVWETTSAEPLYTGPPSGFVVMDPTGPPRVPVYTINHKAVNVRLYAVTPADWPAFVRFREDRHYDAGAFPPGKLMLDRALPIAGRQDEMIESAIDLAPALRGGLGHVVAWISPAPFPKGSRPAQARHAPSGEESLLWVQVTHIGLDVFTDATDMTTWTTSLADGKPLDGVEISLEPNGPRGKSGADGLARFSAGDSAAPTLLVARRGGDVAMLPYDQYRGRHGWRQGRPRSELLWYVFDDRHMYRPGEVVRWKGWLRNVDRRKGGDLGALGARRDRQVTWALKDARDNQVAKGRLVLNALGGFDGSVNLPRTMNLGSARLQLGLTDAPYTSYVHTFDVQEFRRPEFEVKAKSPPGPHFIGGTAAAVVTASYYAGGGLANAPVRWSVHSEATSYAPPGHDAYTFGTWLPWWSHRQRPSGHRKAYPGVTDGAGNHALDIALEGVKPPGPVRYHAVASVMDVNRQQWSALTEVLAHPGERYVGLKSPRLFVESGQPIYVDAIVTDVDGSLARDTSVTMRAVRLERVQRGGREVLEEVALQTCKLPAAARPQRCTFKTSEGGAVKVRATVADGKQRDNQSELTLWVAGEKRPPLREVTQEAVTLIPTKKSYGVGETAEILVQAPFAPAEGVLSLRRSGLLETRRFSMRTASHTLRVPIAEGYVPNVTVQVNLVGAQVRVDDAGAPQPKLSRRPAFASGVLDLSVPPRARTLTVALAPEQRSLTPGSRTSIDVTVKDARGKPAAQAEVAVVVVDESVLALSGYRLPDPLELFYPRRQAEVDDGHLRAHVLLAKPVLPSLPGAVEGTALGARWVGSPPPRAQSVAESVDGDESDRTESASIVVNEPIALRTNFDALAVFAPAVPTDSHGRAKVSVKVPDNLTRYRVMAVAVHGPRSFGMGESTITVRLPLMARPSAPRFLNFGDKFELPVVLQNQTDKDYDAQVVVRASNARMLGGDAANAVGRSVSVPANGRLEVRFPVAALLAGTARFQVGAVAGRFRDAAEVTLPVWTPATTEAFATYGALDEGAVAQPMKAPSAVYPQFGGLEISTSSTELQALTDAVLYLVKYPFECAEQLSSRVLATAALKDVLGAFKAQGLPPPEEIVAAVKGDVRRLEGLQNGRGGFGFWRQGEQDWPYVSVHVMHALVRAKEKGFAVPETMLSRGHDYLKKVERYMPSSYPANVREAIVAYALYVRARLGDRDVTRASAMLSQGLDRVGLETIAWLYPVLSGDKTGSALVTKIRQHLDNKVSEEAGTAHFTTGYGDGAYLLLGSDRRVDGILLEALIGDQPGSDLIPKLVRGLLAHRTAGRWQSTQESAWVLLGLERYFHAFEKQVPNFTARAWLGDQLAGEHAFKGRTTERSQVNVPMAMLATIAGTRPQRVTLAKEGPGRLYYRIGMRYAPRNLQLPPAEHGFTVQRTYQGIDEGSDVALDPQGVWRIKAGARVRVMLTMLAPTRRYHVALVDPMPAGLEAVNAGVEVSPLPTWQAEGPDRWQNRDWMSRWYDHQNLRDDRVEAFTTLLPEGAYTYSYVARATTPGHFVVPPAKAEEMYHPETFGRSGGDRVIVE